MRQPPSMVTIRHAGNQDSEGWKGSEQRGWLLARSSSPSSGRLHLDAPCSPHPVSTPGSPLPCLVGFSKCFPPRGFFYSCHMSLYIAFLRKQIPPPSADVDCSLLPSVLTNSPPLMGSPETGTWPTPADSLSTPGSSLYLRVPLSRGFRVQK